MDMHCAGRISCCAVKHTESDSANDKQQQNEVGDKLINPDQWQPSCFALLMFVGQMPEYQHSRACCLYAVETCQPRISRGTEPSSNL